jgi:hypothetical protein
MAFSINAREAGIVPEAMPPSDLPAPYRPTADEIDDLLRRAAAHELGTDYLQRGALDSVAATFQVHAFVVEAARRALESKDSTLPDHGRDPSHGDRPG